MARYLPLFSLFVLTFFGCKTISNQFNLAQHDKTKQVTEEHLLEVKNGKYFQINSKVPYTGNMISFHENENKKEEGFIENGYKNGLWIEWYIDGKKNSIRKYGNGIIDRSYVDQEVIDLFIRKKLKDMVDKESFLEGAKDIIKDYMFLYRGVSRGKMKSIYSIIGPPKGNKYSESQKDEYDQYRRTVLKDIRRSNGFGSELLLMKSAFHLLEKANQKSPHNATVWFLMGEVNDEILFLDINKDYKEFLSPNYSITNHASSFYVKVLELDPYFDNNIFVSEEEFGEFFNLDHRSKIIAKYGTLAYGYKHQGKMDSMKIAYDRGISTGAFQGPLFDIGKHTLASCDSNAILFTNGDNDTYPLWYLQDYENFGKDVCVVNVNLLNNPWYVKHVRESRSSDNQFIVYSDDQIAQLSSNLQSWETQTVKIPVLNDPENTSGFMEWELKPTYGRGFLRFQDLVLMHIVQVNAFNGWKRPIYFANTIAKKNRLGLEQYMELEGMVFELNSHEVKPIDIEKLKTNLMGKYSYEFVNHSISQNMPSYQRFIQNYRSSFLQLAVTFYMDYNKENNSNPRNDKKLSDLKNSIIDILNTMENKIPSEKIDFINDEIHYQVARIYGELNEKAQMKSILDQLVIRENIKPLNKVEYAKTLFKEFDDVQTAVKVLEDLRLDFLKKEKIIKQEELNNAAISEIEWRGWQKAYPDIIQSLIFIYKENNQLKEAEAILAEWIQRYPTDENAKGILKEIQDKGKDD